MRTLATLNEKIVQRERIDLAGQSGGTIALTFVFLFAAAGIMAGYLIVATQGFSPLFFAVSVFFLTGLIYSVSRIWKMIGSAYIKGEMLIVKYTFGKFKVTELRSIRGVKTVKIPGLRLTSIRYKIDGNYHKVLIFGKTSYLQDQKTIIDTARKVA
jgi:hypothetical protein